MTRHDSISDRALSTAATLEALQARYALRLAGRLNEGAQSVGPDISERLRFAREQALARAARQPRVDTAARRAAATGSSPDRAGAGWWWKLAAVLPVMALVAGLVLIQDFQADTQIAAAAAVDAALLSDDLPPNAYRDAGFVEFLRVSNE